MSSEMIKPSHLPHPQEINSLGGHRENTRPRDDKFAGLPRQFQSTDIQGYLGYRVEDSETEREP